LVHSEGNKKENMILEKFEYAVLRDIQFHNRGPNAERIAAHNTKIFGGISCALRNTSCDPEVVGRIPQEGRGLIG
jgi:hypothetical protein